MCPLELPFCDAQSDEEESSSLAGASGSRLVSNFVMRSRRFKFSFAWQIFG